MVDGVQIKWDGLCGTPYANAILARLLKIMDATSELEVSGCIELNKLSSLSLLSSITAESGWNSW